MSSYRTESLLLGGCSLSRGCHNEKILEEEENLFGIPPADDDDPHIGSSKPWRHAEVVAQLCVSITFFFAKQEMTN